MASRVIGIPSRRPLYRFERDAGYFRNTACRNRQSIHEHGSLALPYPGTVEREALAGRDPRAVTPLTVAHDHDPYVARTTSLSPPST